MRRLAAVAVTALLLQGCGGSSAEPGPVVVTGGLERLGAAIAGLDGASSRLLELPPAVLAVPAAHDEADEAAAAGDRAGARTAVARAQAADAAAASARDGLPAARTAVDAAARELQDAAAAATALDDVQRRALGAVATGAGEESAATAALVEAAAAAAPVDGRLREALATWGERAAAGWYRTAAEGAAAYAVLVRPLRRELDASRGAITAADTAWRDAVDAQQRRTAAADELLAPLRGSG